MSAALFGHAITANFCLGISIVLISMHQFFTDLDRRSSCSTSTHYKVHTSPSMEHFVDAAPAASSHSVHLTERTALLPR
jgi:hypothetical protein